MERKQDFQDIEEVTADSDEIPPLAYFWEILRRNNNQTVASEIFSDDDARELLKKGGWFSDDE